MPLSNLDVARYVKKSPSSLTRQGILDYFITEGYETSEVLTALEAAIQEGLINKKFAEPTDSFQTEDDSAEVWKGGHLVNEQRGHAVPDSLQTPMPVARQRPRSVSGPRCLTCNSTDIEKIRKSNLLEYVAAFPIALTADLASGVGKTFRCKSCGYRW